MHRSEDEKDRTPPDSLKVGLVIGGIVSALIVVCNNFEHPDDLSALAEETKRAITLLGPGFTVLASPVIATIYKNGERIRAGIESAIGIAIPTTMVYYIADIIRHTSQQ